MLNFHQIYFMPLLVDMMDSLYLGFSPKMRFIEHIEGIQDGNYFRIMVLVIFFLLFFSEGLCNAGLVQMVNIFYPARRINQ
jgi:hypothetical protein